MLCPSCRRDSRTGGICEWCRQLLPLPNDPTVQMNPACLHPGQQPTMQMNPTNPNMRRRVSLSGDVIEDAIEPTQTMPPQMGTMQTQAMPPRYPGQAAPYAHGGGAQQAPTLANPNALPPGAFSAAAMDYQYSSEETSLGERWEKAMAFSLPLVALSLLIIHFAPGSFFMLAALNLFAIPIILCGTRAISSFDEAIVDTSAVLIMTILIGPVITLIAYGLYCAVRQEGNGAIFSILLLNLVIRYLFALVFATPDTASLLTLFSVFGLVPFMGVFLSFIGWLVGGLFRPVSDLPSV